jgi:hypothetical protein
MIEVGISIGREVLIDVVYIVAHSFGSEAACDDIHVEYTVFSHHILMRLQLSNTYGFGVFLQCFKGKVMIEPGIGIKDSFEKKNSAALVGCVNTFFRTVKISKLKIRSITL